MGGGCFLCLRIFGERGLLLKHPKSVRDELLTVLKSLVGVLILHSRHAHTSLFWICGERKRVYDGSQVIRRGIAKRNAPSKEVSA